jgi:uncharacterized protein YukJ
MAHTYGFIKCKVVSDPTLKPSRHKSEIQYHLHTALEVRAQDGTSERWDSAINVGTSDSDDLLRYKLVFDFRHPLVELLRAADQGFAELTTTSELPALDFLRSDVLTATGAWRDSDVMDGSDQVEPVASLLRLLRKAHAGKSAVYVFGRQYVDGLGIHDVHMNQGSGAPFLNNGVDDHNDHNDVWQDGAVLIDIGEPEWVAYFTAFTQQLVPTDELGNPDENSHEIDRADEGSLGQ